MKRIIPLIVLTLSLVMLGCALTPQQSEKYAAGLDNAQKATQKAGSATTNPYLRDGAGLVPGGNAALDGFQLAMAGLSALLGGGAVLVRSLSKDKSQLKEALNAHAGSGNADKVIAGVQSLAATPIVQADPVPAAPKA